MPENNAPEPMPDHDLDPGASTEMFQAYVDRYQPTRPEEEGKRAVMLTAATVVVLVVVVVLVWLLVR